MKIPLSLLLGERGFTGEANSKGLKELHARTFTGCMLVIAMDGVMLKSRRQQAIFGVRVGRKDERCLIISET